MYVCTYIYIYIYIIISICVYVYIYIYIYIYIFPPFAAPGSVFWGLVAIFVLTQLTCYFATGADVIPDYPLSVESFHRQDL